MKISTLEAVLFVIACWSLHIAWFSWKNRRFPEKLRAMAQNGAGLSPLGCVLPPLLIAVVWLLAATPAIGPATSKLPEPAHPSPAPIVESPTSANRVLADTPDPYTLTAGRVYRVDKTTRLMPLSPDDSEIAKMDSWLNRVRELAPGGMFRVVKPIRDGKWYEVSVSDGTSEWTAWINATTFIGQALEDVTNDSEAKARRPADDSTGPSSSGEGINALRETMKYTATEDTVTGGICIAPTGKKYHRCDCRTLKGERKQTTSEAAIAAGYTPCLVCNP